MELSGSIEIARPAHEVVAALYDPNTLKQLLPGQARLAVAGPGAFDFTFSRPVGPITLHLPVALRLEPLGLAFSQSLSARASHALAGKVALQLALALTALPLTTRLNWSGTITGQGMAGRALQDNAPRVQAGACALVLRLKHQIEASDPQA